MSCIHMAKNKMMKSVCKTSSPKGVWGVTPPKNFFRQQGRKGKRRRKEKRKGRERTVKTKIERKKKEKGNGGKGRDTPEEKRKKTT